jgi:hypothetical protein
MKLALQKPRLSFGLQYLDADKGSHSGSRMPGRTIELPKSGFALEIDGRLKTEFSTKEGAEQAPLN